MSSSWYCYWLANILEMCLHTKQFRWFYNNRGRRTKSFVAPILFSLQVSCCEFQSSQPCKARDISNFGTTTQLYILHHPVAQYLLLLYTGVNHSGLSRYFVLSVHLSLRMLLLPVQTLHWVFDGELYKSVDNLLPFFSSLSFYLSSSNRLIFCKQGAIIPRWATWKLNKCYWTLSERILFTYDLIHKFKISN